MKMTPEILGTNPVSGNFIYQWLFYKDKNKKNPRMAQFLRTTRLYLAKWIKWFWTLIKAIDAGKIYIFSKQYFSFVAIMNLLNFNIFASKLALGI